MENIFKTELFKNGDVMIITWFPWRSFPQIRSKMISDCCIFEFLWRSVDEKLLMRSVQSETSVFKFLRCSVNGTWDWKGWILPWEEQIINKPLRCGQCCRISIANFFLLLSFCAAHNGFSLCPLRYILQHCSVEHVNCTFRPPGCIIEHLATYCNRVAERVRQVRNLTIAKYILSSIYAAK